MAKVTLSLTPETLERAREQAEREGMSLSAWMDAAARRHALRDSARRWRDWLTANPDIRDELAEWDAMTAESGAAAWSELEPAE